MAAADKPVHFDQPKITPVQEKPAELPKTLQPDWGREQADRVNKMADDARAARRRSQGRS